MLCKEIQYLFIHRISVNSGGASCRGYFMRGPKQTYIHQITEHASTPT